MNPETIKQVKDAQKALLQATKPAKARKPITREEWLNHAAEVIRKAVAKRGITVPPVKVSCSWPGGGSPVKRIGECWSKSASKAGVNEIFISPKLASSRKVICVLAHELAHAVDDCKHSHKKEFVRIGQEMGLEGKPTQMEPRPEFADAWTAVVVGKWGEFPHSELDKSQSPVKKQTTRLLKCECSDCGSIWRLTQTVIDRIDDDRGMSCPVCRAQGDDYITIGG